MEGQSADRWIGSVVPARLLTRRCHGSLDAITDSERRALRPIGARTAHDVAVATGTLLAGLLVLPGVRIFQGLRPGAADTPRIPHAISAGRRLVLVESVAWPPGGYAASTAGQIHCDGVYIGQSVLPLITAVEHWRVILPAGHKVSACVIVHPTAPGALVLSPPGARDLSWAIADHAARTIRAQLPPGREAVSRKAVATLIAATEQAC